MPKHNLISMEETLVNKIGHTESNKQFSLFYTNSNSQYLLNVFTECGLANLNLHYTKQKGKLRFLT